ncbi:MAG: endolytic transglycosylase MltG [Burkholderiales bacterium]
MLRIIKGLLILLTGLAMLIAAGLFIYEKQTLKFIPSPVMFDLKSGSSLRTVARELSAAGVIGEPLLFEIIGRLHGNAPHIKAGNYEFESPTTPLHVLQKITRGDATQVAVRFIDGWTLKQMREALDAHESIKHDSQGMTNEAVARKLGIPDALAEGWFFPETYHFSRGASDVSILRRAHRLMQTHLNAQWAKRAADLPLATPYEALILASIVEKETGKASDRAMVASVFVNRLRINMRLQTDPTVIYGMGDAFDGNLRRRDLQTDTPWNTYTRGGLPPTPIAMPGLASIQATLNPAAGKMLYFVARGDGSSQFSRTLDEHNAAVNKYQRSGRK